VRRVEGRSVSMCSSCREEWSSWLGYRHVEPIRLMQIGSPRVCAENAPKLRFDRWADIVRSQQDLIKKFCANGHRGTQ
jgi:hypothetical protein